jgi:phosphotransferase system enzyme I (PtsI)
MFGISGSDGIGLGYAAWLDRKMDLPSVSDVKAPINPTTELARLDRALESSHHQIEALIAHAKSISPDQTEIFQTHILLLEDPQFLEAIHELITGDQVDAAKAVRTVTDRYRKLFGEMPNPCFQAKSGDIEDIGRRIIANLQGIKPVNLQSLPSATILLADDFTPSEIIGLDRFNIQGLIARNGSTTSHTAVIARSLGIPMVIGCLVLDHTVIINGDRLIINGNTGEIRVRPTDAEWAEAFHLRESLHLRQQRFRAEVNLPAMTPDGHQIILNANLNELHEMNEVVASGADGIGLFRTEFLYLGRNEPPTEDEQLRAYETVVRGMNGRPVVFRTMDLGGDKQVNYLGIPEEDNPLLGCRALRICLLKPELFQVQLRAILRASLCGPVKIMLPMVTTSEEIEQCKALVKQAADRLTADKISFNSEISIGIMVEVPAAALLAENLAAEVDFFSIGTNDLVQYTLAVDRFNPRLAHLYQTNHPAVLRLIDYVIQKAHGSGKSVSVCGEMASQPSGALLLLGMGVDQLSVNPAALPEIKSLIRRTPLKIARKMAEDVMGLKNSNQIDLYLQDYLNSLEE